MEQKFSYNELPVRTITDENEETWFSGVDVCTILGYADTAQAIEKLDEDERKLDRIKDGSGQNRKTWTVNEFGLYSLILTSSKPEAKVFKRWVTHEVLPAIRKAGKYTPEQEKEREISLNSVANQIEQLKNERAEYQKKVNDLRRDIDEKTAEMIYLIKQDRSQLKIEFPKD